MGGKNAIRIQDMTLRHKVVVEVICSGWKLSGLLRKQKIWPVQHPQLPNNKDTHVQQQHLRLLYLTSLLLQLIQLKKTSRPQDIHHCTHNRQSGLATGLEDKETLAEWTLMQHKE
jgi:hypothetical protein